MEANERPRRRSSVHGDRLPTIRSLVTSTKRAAAVGSALHLLTSLLSLLRRKKGKQTSSRLGAILSALLGAGRMGLITALMSAGARSALWLLRRKLGLGGKIASLSSGVVVALASLMLDATSRKTLALYALVRSGEFCVRAAISEGKWPKILSWKHSDVVLMYMSAAQILWTFRHHVHTLPPAYQQFLHQQGNVSKLVNQAVSDWSYGRPCDVPAISAYVDKQNVPLSYVLSQSGNLIPCHLVHPYQGCAEFGAHFFLGGLKRALKVYVPLNLVFTLLFKNKAIISQPLDVMKGMSLSVFWSTMFLSAYCTTAHMMQCLVLAKLGIKNQFLQYLTVGLSGIPVLLEYKSRRLELALYCWPRALESFWNCAVNWGWMRPIPRFELVLLCLSFGAMSHIYDHHRSCIRSGYRRGLCWLLADEYEETLDGYGRHSHSHRHHQQIEQGEENQQREEEQQQQGEGENGVVS